MAPSIIQATVRINFGWRLHIQIWVRSPSASFDTLIARLTNYEYHGTTTIAANQSPATTATRTRTKNTTWLGGPPGPANNFRTKFKKRISPFIFFRYDEPGKITLKGGCQICLPKARPLFFWLKLLDFTFHLSSDHKSAPSENAPKDGTGTPKAQCSWEEHIHQSLERQVATCPSIEASMLVTQSLLQKNAHLSWEKHQNWKLMMSVWVCTFPTAASCCKRKAWLKAEFFCFPSETIYRRLLSAWSSSCLISFGPFQNVSHGTWAIFLCLKFACHIPPNPPHPSTECLHVHFLLADHSSCQALEQSACVKSSTF